MSKWHSFGGKIFNKRNKRNFDERINNLEEKLRRKKEDDEDA